MGEEHYAAIVRLCLHLLGNRDDAEDAAQETFRRALKQDPGAIDDRLRWLRTVARNVCIDELRRRRTGGAAQPLLQAAPCGDDPERVAVGRAFVDELLGQLTPAERRVVEARLVDDRSGPELAASLGVAPSTARVLLARGLGKLRHYLADSQTALGGAAVGAWRAARQLRRGMVERVRCLAGSGADGPGFAQGLAALLTAAIATLCLCLPGGVTRGQAAAAGAVRPAMAVAPAAAPVRPVAAVAAAPPPQARSAPALPSAPPFRPVRGGGTQSPSQPFGPSDLLPHGPVVQNPSSPGQGIHLVGPVYLDVVPGPAVYQYCSDVPDNVQVHTGPSNPQCRALPGAV